MIIISLVVLAIWSATVLYMAMIGNLRGIASIGITSINKDDHE